MNDITLSDWVANIPNTSVGASLTGTTPLPAEMPPSEVLHQFALGYRNAQTAVNESSSGPLFVNVASPIVFGTSLDQDETGDFRMVTHRISVRQYIDPDSVGANSGTTII